MASNVEVKAIISADDRASAVMRRFGSGLGKLGRIAKVAGVAGFASLAAGAGLSLKAFTESQDAIKQLNTVLKSTKGVAGVTSKAAQDLASSLQRVTKFSDEEIMSAESMLLTFTKIGSKVFPQATETVLNMSQALGQDLKSSSIQLGKALNDPIRGVTALRRVGVAFTTQQEDQIKTLVESGQTLKAQKLILKELNTEFGNSARAAGKTLSGQLTILKNTFGEVFEVVGAGIARVIQPAISAFNKWFQRMGGAEGMLKSFANIWKLLSTGDFSGGIFKLQEDSPFILGLLRFRDILVWIRDLGVRILDGLRQAWNFLDQSVIALVNTVRRDLLPVLSRLWKEILLPLIPIIATAFVIAIRVALSVLNILVKVVSALTNFLLDNKEAVLVLAGVYASAKVAGAIGGLITNFRNAASAIRSTGSAARALAASNPYAVLATVAVLAAVTIMKAWEKTAAAIQNAKAAASNYETALINARQTTERAYREGKITTERYIQLQRDQGRPGAIGSQLKQHGGSVMGSRGYIVGERGPEFFRPPSGGGTIVPNRQLKGGAATANVTIHAGVFMGSPTEARKVAKMISEAMKDLAGARSMTTTDYLNQRVSP